MHVSLVGATFDCVLFSGRSTSTAVWDRQWIYWAALFSILLRITSVFADKEVPRRCCNALHSYMQPKVFGQIIYLKTAAYSQT
eukprot:4105565-Amphidinium_carterae.1